MRTLAVGSKKKVLLVILLILAGLILAYALFCAVAPRFFYPEFYPYAYKVAAIPDLWADFIPQGVTYSPYDGSTLICGYMPGDQASRIYRLGDKPVRIELEREDGTVYDGHAGGMTAAGDYIYISNASKLFVLRAEDVMNAADGDVVRFIGHFEVPCRASFCSNSDGMVYVGDYHAEGYETEESHVMETADGEHAAMVFGYRLDEEARFGVEEIPSVAYSVCDKVQGFAVTPEGVAILSCSYGLADSELKLYHAKDAGSFAYEGQDLPLYVLDSGCEIVTVRAPHMSEDIEYLDGGLLIAFEAGAKKYGGGILPFSVRSVMRWASPEITSAIAKARE